MPKVNLDQLRRALALVEQDVADGKIPGAVARVLVGGEAAGELACGWAHTEPRLPMTMETIFDLASLTKIVGTLSAVSLLVQRGQLRLDDPVVRFLPTFTGDGRDQVRIRHLLSHTAGLPATRAYVELGCQGREAIMADICSLPLQGLGKQIVYSDLGFMLLGWAVEAISGQGLDEFIVSALFDPLGMQTTCYNPPAAWQNRCAATERRPFMDRHQWGYVHDRNAGLMSGVSGHAGLFSTVDDLTTWVQALFWPNGGEPIAPAVAQELRRPLASIGSQCRAWGWIVNGQGPSALADLMGPQGVGHTGFTGTGIWYDPDGDWAAILLTNRVHYGRQETAQPIASLRGRFLNAVAAAIQC